MKISNNLTFNKLQNYKSAVSKQAVSKPFVQSDGINTSPAVSAQLYQAYNNISFGQNNSDEKESVPSFFVIKDYAGTLQKIFCRITLDSGESRKINISQDTIDRFLKNEEGNINKEAFKQFVSTYTAVLQGIIKQDNDENEFLRAIVNGKSPSPKESNITYINPNDEVKSSLLSSLSEPSENFVYAFLNSIKNEETRKDFAGFLSNALNEQFGNIEYQSGKAMERTINLFDICQNNDGFDFSNMQEKMEFAIKLEDIQWNYGCIGNEGVSEDIIKHSKDEEGKFDIDFAWALCRLIKNADLFCPETLVSHRSDLLHIYTAMDSDNTEQIVDTMVKLSSIIQINDEDTRFESVFGQAFNNVTGKYDEKAAQLLLELAPLVNEATRDIPIDTREDFENYKKTKQNLISGYFKQAKDKETGKIKEDAMSPADYISYLHFLY